MALRDSTAAIDDMNVACYRIPTDKPEADGTYEWDATTLVVAHIAAAGVQGLGYGYADAATARCMFDTLLPAIEKCDAFATNARYRDMARAVRNLGRPGIAAMAISIVDIALWDLKAKCLGISLAQLLGEAHDAIAAYGSGGFTTYSLAELEQQLGDWAAQGFRAVKMKIGREPEMDLVRVGTVRKRIGNATRLFVDANGAYTRKQALHQARAFAECDVAWFEEPVSSDDLSGLHLLREHGPASMDIAAGEYGYTLDYFRNMLAADAVDVLQVDATRCGGVTGFLGAAALCEAFHVPLSAHCAPSLHIALCCAARSAVHLEYFHDHARIEHMLFDGAAAPINGMLAPALDRPGLGLVFKEKDAQCYKAS